MKGFTASSSVSSDSQDSVGVSHGFLSLRSIFGIFLHLFLALRLIPSSAVAPVIVLSSSFLSTIIAT